MKSKKIDCRLRESLGRDVLVRLKREPLQTGTEEGFVVGLSNRWVLLHSLNGDSLHLDGYRAFRRDTITSARKDKTFALRALHLRNESAVLQPEIDLSDLKNLLMTANSIFPLIGFEQERLYPGTLYIGRVTKCGRKNVEMEYVDTKARWDGKQPYTLKDITCVQFGGGYEEALFLVAEDEQQPDAGV